MKNKKLLLVATAALGVLALGTAGVGTAAWFVAADNTVTKITAETGTLDVVDNSAQAGDVYVKVTWGTDNGDGKVVYTNELGKTYYYVGSVGESTKIGPITPDGSTYMATSNYTFTVSLHGNAAGTSDPSAEALKSAAGTYTLTFTATGEVKIGNDAAAAVAVTAASSTATHSITFGASGLTAGASGSVYYGFIGSNSEQTGAGGTIQFTSVSAT